MINRVQRCRQIQQRPVVLRRHGRQPAERLKRSLVQLPPYNGAFCTQTGSFGMSLLCLENSQVGDTNL